MIKQYFPSTQVKPWYQIAPTRVLSTAPPFVASALTVTSREKAQAIKLGLSIEEYQKRCVIVAKASNECKLQYGDVVYPVKPSDLKKYGALIVIGVCRHYDQYGKVDWKENNPFILTLARCADRSETVQCTGNWADKRQVEVTNGC